MSDKATLLFVDDEERVLRSLEVLFKNRFRVLTTTDGSEAVAMVRRERVHVIVSDQRMPIMTGVEVLRRVREASPNTMRLLLTGYSDLEAIVNSVNEGEIFRYLSKPWSAKEILVTVTQAAEIALSLEEAAGAEPQGVAPGVLVIDEDPTVAEMVKAICGPSRPVKWSSDLDEAFETLAGSDIAIVVCDIRLRGRDISAAVRALKESNPLILTIVQTQLQDVEMLRSLINHGQIYRFLPKPARRGLLEMSLHAASRRHLSLMSAPKLANRYQVKRNDLAPVAALSIRLFGYLDRMRQGKGF
ncbi:MAG TPA: response regulator [Gammaproteobacteria bacterium]|jgi:DNA-binding NtrC family response regulator|nr:response regulator [Gammaproteobacteria bacterium]